MPDDDPTGSPLIEALERRLDALEAALSGVPVVRIGPVHVAFSDANIDGTSGPGVHLYTPTPGDLVVGAWFFWDQNPDNEFDAGGLQVAADPAGGFDYWSLSLSGQAANLINAGLHWRTSGTSTLFSPFIALTLDAEPIVACCFGQPTKGEGDVQLLVIPA